ncbi:unnamed protein product, partial [Meganyctiphanes norvegica]
MTEIRDKSGMKWHVKLAYGVGHFFNDLCASMWFTYLLVFFDDVMELGGIAAGILLLVGQLADGMATPIVGMLCDRKINNAFVAKYGRRKIWHLIGTILVAVTFPFIWGSCLGCSGAETGTKMVYYSFFIILFQFGWAATQISHLALIPDLTTMKKQRTELNSIRYAFTVIANLSVYTIMFFVLDYDCDTDVPEVDGNSTTIAPKNEISTTMGPTSTIIVPDCSELGPEDSSKFSQVAYICLGIGLAFSILFQLGVHEKPYTTKKQEKYANAERRSSNKNAMKKLDWFKELPFYQIAVLYMATRLYVNLYQSYIVLYIQDTLMLPVATVATVPFVMYAAGFAGSIVMEFINSKIGRKATFTLGCLVGLSGCIWVGLDRSEEFNNVGIYMVASLLGIGGSTLLITSLSLTADLIGDNVEGGAFVYGFMSLVDKFSNGIIIMLIQSLGENQPEGSNFYQMVITYACGSACVLGILVIMTLINRSINTRNNSSRKSTLVISTFDDDNDQQDNDSDGGIGNQGYEEKDDTIAISGFKECGVDSTAAAITAVTKCTENTENSNSNKENQKEENTENSNSNKENQKEGKVDEHNKDKKVHTLASSGMKSCGKVDSTAAAITAVTKCTENTENSNTNKKNQKEDKVGEDNKDKKVHTLASSGMKSCGKVDSTAAAITAVTKCTENTEN